MEREQNERNVVELDWHRWCRLCAKQDSNNCSVFSCKELDGVDTNIATAIGKYFWVNIKRCDDLPKTLCHECYGLISSLISFTDRVNKVQSMYSVLQNLNTNERSMLIKARTQYGLIDNERRFIFKEEVLNDSLIGSTENDSDEIGKIYYEIEESEEATDEKAMLEEKYTYIEYSNQDDLKHSRTRLVSSLDREQEHRKTARTATTDIDKKSSAAVIEEVNDMEVDSFEIYSEGDYKVEADENDDDIIDNKEVEDDGDTELDTEAETEFYTEHDAEVDTKNSHISIDEDHDDADIDYLSQQQNDDTKSESFSQSVTESHLSIYDEDLRFTCKHCNRIYKNPTSYRKHMMVIHDVEPDIPEFICSQCNKVFITVRQLNTHIRTHLPPEEKMRTPCPHCPKKFSTAAVLKQHVACVHSNHTPFICDICGKRLKTRAALNEHKFVHTSDCPFECDVCHKRFKNKARLKLHADIHTACIYTCTVCGMNLNTRRTLKMHMLVHSDERQFKCDFCQASFKRSKALKNHLILHTGLRPYKCDFCQLTFSNGSNCRSHTKKTHPVELAEQEAKGVQKKIVTVPNIDELRSCPKMLNNPRSVNRSSGGLPVKVRQLLIAAEEREKQLALEAEEAQLTETAETLANISKVVRYNTDQKQSNSSEIKVVEDSDSETVVYEVIEY
ncbi:zinc finger protein 224-like [Teleopsis dalmanni]|uniref:zinc finger protein 224-like n=1 Tax=Teleopsis dalmanni TaxID=139649 RepID=UPI0018CD6D40|nr:zinc finger protein 224-like [Teleopsis dalmanni]